MDNFHIYEPIGQGKFSTVYKARKRKTIQYAAAKRVDKFHKQKVVNEVKILNILDHPNILKFHNWYETSNHYWIIIEFCSGGDLMNMLAQDSALPEETVHMFGMDLVNGLQLTSPGNTRTIHSKGIIYCDLKPSNVLIDGCGVLKLSDFGLAQQVKEIEASIGKENGNLAAGPPKRGSPCYMAPELFQGGFHSVYSDLWSLGCVLYELASGSPPFIGQTFESLVDNILNQEVKYLSNCSADFNDLIRSLLQKKPSERLNWDTLREHKFWKEPLRVPTQEEKKFLLPPPQSFTPTSRAAPQDTKQNVLRLSKIVKSNIEKERGSSYEEHKGHERSTNDVEYNFDESEEEEETRKGSETDVDETLDEHGEIEEELEEEQSRTVSPPFIHRRHDSDVSSDSNVRSHRHSHTSTTIINEANVMISTVQAMDLLFSESESIVKPIITNSRIEKRQEAKYEKDKLSFTPFSLDEVLKMSQTALEQFLTTVYKSIGGVTPTQKKMNVLCYFETLCTDSRSANLFINTSLMKLFVTMLKSNKSPMLKCRLCSVMGLLMRHALYISSDLGNTGIFEVFLDLLEDKNVNVKKRSIACIGELLFYIACQEETKEDEWNVPNEVIVAVIDALKSTDEIIQHYATKTIENITAQKSQYYTLKFTTTETVKSLIRIFLKTQNEYLKASSITSLSSMCRHKNALSLQIVELLSPITVVSLLKDSNAKVQQCALNLINISLITDSTSKQCQKVVEQPEFADNIMDLMEFTTPLLRGKSVMTLYLMSNANQSFITQCCEKRLCILLDRMSNKEKDSYVRKCMINLLDAIAKIVPPIVESVAQSLEGNVSVKQQSLTTVLHIMTTPCISQRVVTTEFINYMARCMQLLQPSAPFEDFTKTLLLIIEALSQQQAVISQSRAIAEKLLPSLVHMIKSDSGDIRFLGLKIFTDILVRYLNDPNIYNAQEGSQSIGCTHAINEFIIQTLLPRFGFILDDQDPIPLYGLKLLNNIAEHNPSFIGVINKLNLIPKLFEFFELEHRNNNVHNVRLILKIIAADVMDDEVMYNLGLVAKLNAVLSYAFTNGVETFFEPCLGIVDHLLYRSSRLIHKCQSQPVEKAMKERANQMHQYNEPLIDNLSVYLELICHTDVSIAEASAHVLLLLAQQYSSIHDALTSSKGLPLLRKGLIEYIRMNQLASGSEVKSMHDSILEEQHSVGNYILKLILIMIQSNTYFVGRVKLDDHLQNAISKLAALDPIESMANHGPPSPHTSTSLANIAQVARQIEKVLSFCK